MRLAMLNTFRRYPLSKLANQGRAKIDIIEYP
jgi:hypothetical protein